MKVLFKSCMRLFLLMAIMLQAFTAVALASDLLESGDVSQFQSSKNNTSSSSQDVGMGDIQELGEEESTEESSEDSDAFEFENMIPGQASALSFVLPGLKRTLSQRMLFKVRSISPLHRPPQA